MTNEYLLMTAIFIVGTGSIWGFFKTKTEGFGRFTTSTLLILLVLTISGLLYSAGKLQGDVMANVLFAVFGLCRWFVYKQKWQLMAQSIILSDCLGTRFIPPL